MQSVAREHFRISSFKGDESTTLLQNREMCASRGVNHCRRGRKEMKSELCERARSVSPAPLKGIISQAGRAFS